MAKSKILCLTPAIILLLSTLGLTFAPSPAIATPDELRWSPVNIPTEGRSGHWQLAPGADIEHLTISGNGTLYAYANPSGTSYTLFKSTDGGERWSYTGQVSDNIVAIATAPDDANAVYYTTNTTVYKSADGGNSFSPLPVRPDGAGNNNIEITSLSIASLNNRRIIAVGTRDRDSAQYGGIYTVDENELFAGWVNTNIGNYDVCALAFSPNYASDRQLIAVATDETNTLVTSRLGNTDWGRVTGNVTINGIAPRKATIAFPNDYNAATENATLFLGIDTGTNNGDVYRIGLQWAPARSIATDLNIGSSDNLPNVDVTGLAVSGNNTGYHLLAGAATSTRVYISTDGGQNWSNSQKEPTGQSKTYLLMAPDFAHNRRAYAVTSGAGSAFSYTTDGGSTWNQLSLIDTQLSQIIDLAVSPKYGQDSTLFLLTWGGEHSLWRSQDGGVHWERVFTSTLAGATSLSHLELSPQYGTGVQVVFLAGRSGSQGATWKSKDNGQTFARRFAWFLIDTLTAVNDDTLFAASYNGTNSLAYGSANSGFFVSDPGIAGIQPLRSLALSPNYPQDKTILVGNTNGWVYWSADNGTSFEALPPNATTPPLTGSISVAFDPEFRQNKIVYAASDTVATASSKERIYRFIIGKSNAWESIDGTLPVGSILNQLAAVADGTLYATNSMVNGGIERSLNPRYPLNPAFETVTRGLTDNATLTELWFWGNQLWAIDTRNSRLMTFTDSLTLPVTLTSPPDKAPGISTSNVKLDWHPLPGATKYHWQVDDDANFASVSANYEGDTEGSSTPSPSLEMATIYYWRARAIEPVLGPWSAKWSFTTSLGVIVIAPELYTPKAGATGMPRRPIFQWSAIAGAERYELLVSTNVSFSNPIINKIGNDALPATAWQSDVTLDYATTYYWKIRGTSANSYSAWSAVGAFTTEPLPQAQLSTPEPPSPAPQTVVPLPAPALPSPPPSQSLPPPTAQPILPTWSIYTAIALLLTIVILLAMLLIVVIRR